MSGSAHRGDHDIAFYEATLGHTYAGSGGVAPSFVNSDDDGALPPARYLIQLVSSSSPTATCWVSQEPFEKGVAPSSIAGAGPRRFPLRRDTLLAIETHVVGNDDDRITLQTDAGTCVVWVSRVSTLTPRGTR